MAREVTIFYKRLVSLLSMKREQPYSSNMTWLRCLFSFSLLHSAIQSIRGAHSSKGHPISNNSAPSDLINSEGLLPGPCYFVYYLTVFNIIYIYIYSYRVTLKPIFAISCLYFWVKFHYNNCFHIIIYAYVRQHTYV